MKRILATFATLFAITAAIQAMSYEQARQQALFLTDKMAYELNLTEEQYEAAYEVNLDYLMSVNTVDDLYSVYWTRRNLDLSYILFDWQYRAFCDAAYFYRPLYWNAGYWHFRIYTRYPHRNYFYFGRPHFWTVYRGGHSWHSNGGRSWYHGRDFGHKRALPITACATATIVETSRKAATDAHTATDSTETERTSSTGAATAQDTTIAEMVAVL